MRRADREASSTPARPTLRDVAALAGVSFKTVSRVINAETGVRPETASRVLVAVRQLGYQPNAMASSLKRGRSQDTIGLVIEDVSNPFFATVARAAEEVTREAGILIIMASSDEDRMRERRVIDSLLMRRVRGLIVVPIGRDHRYLAREMRSGMAVVFLDRPPGRLRADTVLMDNAGGARMAVDHLIRHGHRRIAVLTDSLEVYTMGERYAGYRAALRSAGLPLVTDLVKHDCHDIRDAQAATVALLSRADPPTALFTTNNRMTVGALNALAHRERRPALVGFDDLELATALSTPVSVVSADNEGLGRLGAQLLLRRMHGWAGPPEHTVLAVRLIERGSGELAPGP